jgi:hypothetical protein
VQPSSQEDQSQFERPKVDLKQKTLLIKTFQYFRYFMAILMM